MPTPCEIWFERFEEVGAIWRYREGGPHAAYEMIDRHAGFYFNTDIITAKPRLTDEICQIFASKCRARQIQPDWVISYKSIAESGLALAERLAQLLQARFGFVDLRQNVRLFCSTPGQSVLLVTDDIHSGRSLARTIELVEQAGARVLSRVFTMGNFSGSPLYKNMKIFSLIDQKVDSCAQAECPWCVSGSPALKARQKWRQLMESMKAESIKTESMIA